MGDVINMKPWRWGDMEMPERMRASLLRYVNDRVMPGGFLMSVLCNNLLAAVQMADDQNIKIITVYVQWLVLNAPPECWGSIQNVDRWLSQ